MKELFQYKNGELYWKKLNFINQIKIGDKVDSIDKINKYKTIKFNNKSYKSHQLIFLYHHGYIPKEIDHIDGNSLNNNINNLREVTHQQNSWNQKKNRSHNGKPTSSIYKGVSWHKQIKKWVVRIRIDGKNKSLGVFDNEKVAAFIYNIYAIKYYGEYAYLNIITD